MTSPRNVVLVVLDGWGISDRRGSNAIALARTPNYLELINRFANTALEASGERVGLPSGQMGNSEVGHMNMGAGRVVYQDLTRIDASIREGDFFRNPALVGAFDRASQRHSAVHLLGLVSDGGVHSHIRHLNALLDLASQRQVSRVFIHAFTDGRDTSPTSGIRFVRDLESACRQKGIGRLATVSGRYYAMDRDKRWDRTRLAYDAMVRGQGPVAESASRALQNSYDRSVTDEFILPTVLTSDGRPVATIGADDAVVCFNFRADRVRQVTRAMAVAGFDAFERAAPVADYTCLTEYDEVLPLPVAYRPQTFSRHLGEMLETLRANNLRLAETEKYAHVTYFFNCGRERPFEGEDRLLIPSPGVATYDLQPEMSAYQIADELERDIRSGAHRVVIANFANADMVGHTGNLEATIRAVQVLDECIGRVIRAIQASGSVAVITADHGNCEQMWDGELNAPHTAHTSNPVPFLLIDPEFKGRLRPGGALCDVAPTILGLLEHEQPEEMTGRDLREA